MTEIRKHRDTLEESMKTVFNVAGRKELLEVLRQELGAGVEDRDLTIRRYGHDSGAAWDTHMIVVAGQGLYGFSNGPLAP